MAATGTAPSTGPGVDEGPLPGLFLGLISGTSADGIDAALVEFHGDTRLQARLVAGRTFPWAAELR